MSSRPGQAQGARPGRKTRRLLSWRTSERGRADAARMTPLRIRKARRAAIAASSPRARGRMRQRPKVSGEPAALRRLILGHAHSSRSFPCRPRLSSLLLCAGIVHASRTDGHERRQPPLTWRIRAVGTVPGGFGSRKGLQELREAEIFSASRCRSGRRWQTLGGPRSMPRCPRSAAPESAPGSPAGGRAGRW
jgi:hypothetical protein